MDNIRFGRLDATDDEVVAAAKLANADGFIRRLPEGYNTVLTGDGANLSQGQETFLAIARAAVADPPVLILDEATSSIDTRTERIVQEGMDRLMHGRTTFVIAHRLSTVRNSDCIMVLEQGRIIERGRLTELMRKRKILPVVYRKQHFRIKSDGIKRIRTFMNGTRGSGSGYFPVEWKVKLRYTVKAQQRCIQ